MFLVALLQALGLTGAGREIAWQAGVMDMFSTTGVEVMTEVVTEASVGEAALICLTLRFILNILNHY